MAEQSFKNHAHRPIHTTIVWLFALVALILMVQQLRGDDTRDWAIIFAILGDLRARLDQPRLHGEAAGSHHHARREGARRRVAAAGGDAQLAKLNSKQIAALRFASDEEFGALLERAARENLQPKDIKASIKTWRPDFHRT